MGPSLASEKTPSKNKNYPPSNLSILIYYGPLFSHKSTLLENFKIPYLVAYSSLTLALQWVPAVLWVCPSTFWLTWPSYPLILAPIRHLWLRQWCQTVGAGRRRQ